MPPLRSLRPEEVVRALERAGFVRSRQTGSHLRLFDGKRFVTVAMHSRDLKPGTLRAIIRQAGLTVEEFIKLL